MIDEEKKPEYMSYSALLDELEKYVADKPFDMLFVSQALKTKISHDEIFIGKGFIEMPDDMDYDTLLDHAHRAKKGLIELTDECIRNDGINEKKEQLFQEIHEDITILSAFELSCYEALLDISTNPEIKKKFNRGDLKL